MKAPDYRDSPDGELVRLAQREPGSATGRSAAAELLGRYRGRVFVWCRRYVRDREQAQDLAQDVLMNAYRSLDGFEGRAPFGAWLFTITRNRCIRAMRPVALLRDDEAELEGIPDDDPGPEVRFEDREREAQVLALVRRHLEPVEQQALMLRCYERLPVEEITRFLDIRSATGARGVLQSARRKLRAALERIQSAEGGAWS